jgi:hypothetical protein
MTPERKDQFWMICRQPAHDRARTEPKVRYAHRDTAWDDAARLARETGENFVILAVEEVVTPAARLTQGRLF